MNIEERPILFKDEMVRAILEGRKTQTRRLSGLETVNQGKCDLYEYAGNGMFRSLVGGTHQFPRCRYGKPGDHLWVRETWGVSSSYDHLKPSALRHLPRMKVAYHASGGTTGVKRRPSIFMIREFSRITLEVTGV